MKKKSYFVPKIYDVVKHKTGLHESFLRFFVPIMLFYRLFGVMLFPVIGQDSSFFYMYGLVRTLLFLPLWKET